LAHSAKEIRVAPIAATDARDLVRRYHYSGKVVNNSQLHFGVFLGGRCLGAMSFGPSLDKRKLVGLVSGTPWNGFVELNRMAFSDELPRNSESRALGIAFRMLRAKAPHIHWVVSFADATQSGDGGIYRASGFVLTGIKKNTQVWAAPTGARESRTSLTDGRSKTEQARAATVSRTSLPKSANILDDGAASMAKYIAAGFVPLSGFQLRYVYFLDPTARERLTVPILPFSRIAEMGARMYRGKARAESIVADAPAVHAGEGGSIPTSALHLAATVRS
jgi:hypothetical protein